MRGFRLLGAALLGLSVLTVPATAQRPVWEQAGTLNCDVSAGIGLIIGSRREVNCLFTPSYPAPPEQYVGAITKWLEQSSINGGARRAGGKAKSDPRDAERVRVAGYGSQILICPSCGTKNSVSYAKCAKCSKDLGKEKPVPNPYL